MGAIDDLDWMDDREDETEDEATCKHCGKAYLWWYQVGDKWVLFERRPGGHTAPHRCNRGLTKTDIVNQFEDIS